MRILKRLLVVSLTPLINGCLTIPPPKVDLCVILTKGDGWCFPQNQVDKAEYGITQPELVGGFWVSAAGYGEIRRYQKQVEEKLRMCEDQSLVNSISPNSLGTNSSSEAEEKTGF